MEIPIELFYLSTLLFAALAVHTFYRGHREKEGFHYFVGILCLLGLGWSILFALDQTQLAGAFWLIAMIVSVVMLPELTAFQDRRMGEVDIEGPMRLADFFSNTHSGWLKLAYRNGLGMTVILYFILFEAATGGILLALNMFYPLPPRLNMIIMAQGIFQAIWLYRRTKRALTTIHLPQVLQTEN